MIIEPNPSFEALRQQLAALAIPAGEARQLIWVVVDRLGIAMTAGGAYEIFLLGPPLLSASALVAGNLQHDRWEPSAGGEAFEASRVLLGSAAHFAAVAALIATELARLNLSTDAALQQAFSEVEPIIDMAIRRAVLSSEVIVGLIAELHVLRAALLIALPADRAKILPAWRGWAPGRDFVLGQHGIEVKATRGTTSRHSFSGIHQLEPQPTPSGCTEKLHLLSFGLQEVNQGGFSLPELVNDLLSLLSDDTGARSSAQAQLLTMIASYGGASVPNYEHDTMDDWSAYKQRYAITFSRLYEIDDPEMRLLSRELVEQTFAVAASLSFELALPSMISTYNPAQNWQAEVAKMISCCTVAPPPSAPRIQDAAFPEQRAPGTSPP